MVSLFYILDSSILGFLFSRFIIVYSSMAWCLFSLAFFATLLINYYSPMLLLGLKFLASAIAIMAFIGVPIGVGVIFASLVSSISRNPSSSTLDLYIRWAFIGFSLCEVSGFIALVFSFLTLLMHSTLDDIILPSLLFFAPHSAFWLFPNYALWF